MAKRLSPYLDRGGHYKRTHNDKGRCGYEEMRGRRGGGRAEQGKFSLWRAERRDGTSAGEQGEIRTSSTAGITHFSSRDSHQIISLRTNKYLQNI